MIQCRDFYDYEWYTFEFPPDWQTMKGLADSWGFDLREIDENGLEVRAYYPDRTQSKINYHLGE